MELLISLGKDEDEEEEDELDHKDANRGSLRVLRGVLIGDGRRGFHQGVWCFIRLGEVADGCSRTVLALVWGLAHHTSRCWVL